MRKWSYVIHSDYVIDSEYTSWVKGPLCISSAVGDILGLATELASSAEGVNSVCKIFPVPVLYVELADRLSRFTHLIAIDIWIVASVTMYRCALAILRNIDS